MTLAELKIAIIQKIILIDDLNLLMKISDLLESYISDKSDSQLLSVNESVSSYEKINSEKIYVFNEWQQKRIDIALQQVENGEYISDEEAQIEIQKWFEEQEK